MTIPKKITIFGHEYKVVLSKSLKAHDGTPADGLCDYKNHTIYLCQFLPKKEKPQVFLHEVIHAALWECGVGRQLDETLEEVIADGISKMLVKTFKLRLNRDN